MVVTSDRDVTPTSKEFDRIPKTSARRRGRIDRVVRETAVCRSQRPRSSQPAKSTASLSWLQTPSNASTSRIEIREAPVVKHDEWLCALRLVRLPGGLYAINRPQDDEVQLYASADRGNVLCGFKIPVYGALFQGLEKLGLRPLGTIFLHDARQLEGIDPPDARHYYRSPEYEGPWAVWDAARTWSRIAHHAAKADADIPLMDLARRISFELNACSAKWFDLSHAYETVLNGLIRGKSFRAGQRVDNMNFFAVHLAIHSLLSEMSSLRDYLAEFIAQHVLATQLADNPYTKMSNLVGALRKRPDLAHAAVRTVIAITAENGGWLAILSAYRDLVIHHAPVKMTEGAGFAMQKEMEISEGFILPYIETYLPTDPVAVEKERSRGTSIRSLADWNRAFSPAGVAGGPDALIYLHRAVGQLALLSLEMAGYSPIKPAAIVITPEPGTLSNIE